MAEQLVDESHWGLQKLYYACFTNPAVPLAELEPHVEEHKQYLVRLEREGKLFAAGPLLDESNRINGVGMIVFRAASREEADELARNDPFHERGLRTYSITPWQVNEGAFVARLNYSDRTFSID
jgi:uncharacterized protein YciI